MFVKICATTNVADAELAADAGADAVGMIFAASRRRVEVGQAAEIADAVRGRIFTVGVFRDHLPDEVLAIARYVGLDAAQLHGSETPATSRRVHDGVPIVFRAMTPDSPELVAIDDHRADVLLLDAPTPGGGEPFDWSLVGDLVNRHRVLLAGGLRPDNVAEAIAAVRPWGVDVATGTEAAFGVKDPDKVHEFVRRARAAGEDLVDQHGPLPVPPGTVTMIRGINT